MPKGTYGIGGFCVVDAKPIPKDRLSRGSVTCSRECYDARRKAQRAQQDSNECRYCRKVSTPADREAWAKWRRLEKKFPGFLDKITAAQFNKLVLEWETAPSEAKGEEESPLADGAESFGSPYDSTEAENELGD
jgi:hypothetical protein